MAAHSSTARRGSGAQPVVLVVEDDGQISYLLQFLLEQEGYRVVLANDGNEAKRAIDSTQPPHLVLLDIMMPHADGFELLALLRAKSGWQATPVIVLTARSQKKDIARAMNLGASDYVVKPFLLEDLKARIQRFILPSS
jgi:DNA-binding response OmpR family regulator